MNARTIPDDALAVLSAGSCRGPAFTLPSGQLDRKLYEAVNKVLDALGGKWNKKAKAHLFPEDCEPLIESAIETGSYTKPADMGWFPTPDALACRVVRMANIAPGHLVLEPSAGLGAIALQALKLSCHVDCYEIDEKRAARLANEPGYPSSTLGVKQADFLTIEPRDIYDRVVMNPPFAKRADIHHVLHARKFLRPGGQLVAIMSASVEFRMDMLTAGFRDLCDTIEALPDDSFKEAGTGVRTVVVTMERPR